MQVQLSALCFAPYLLAMTTRALPEGGWTTSLKSLPSFTISDIDKYMIEMTSSDGKPSDARKGRMKGWNFWRHEHVRKLFVREKDSRLPFLARGMVRASKKTQVNYLAWTELIQKT